MALKMYNAYMEERNERQLMDEGLHQWKLQPISSRDIFWESNHIGGILQEAISKYIFMSQYDFLLALQPELHCRGGITRMKDKETWEEGEVITMILKNESMKGKQFFAVRTCGLPQIEPDLMYNMTVIISFITVIRLIIITIIVITIITIIIVIMNRWSQASALSSIARSISPAWSPPLDGELGGFFDFLGWSFW